MKLVFGFVCALFYSFMSFGQITQWTDINYANDSLEAVSYTHLTLPTTPYV